MLLRLNMNVHLPFRFTLALHIFDVIIPSKAWIKTVNQTEAEERCKAFGGLASFEHFDPPPGTIHPLREPNTTVPDNLNQIINLLQIEEGKSVWISGRANYSDYMSYHSCRKSFNSNARYTLIEHNDLFLCWNYCDGFEYVGIGDKRCYCLHENIFNSDVCSDRQYINGIHVYLIDIPHYNFQNDTFQCTLESRDISSKKYGTVKCSGKMHGLCRNRFDGIQTLNCSEVNRPSPSFCIFNESVSWVKHRDKCEFTGGMLFPYPYDDTINYMESNIPYTLGIFRTFKPVPKQKKDKDFPCLAVTRVGNKLWLEPDDCAAKRRYMCNNLQYVVFHSNKMTTSSEDRTTIIIVVVCISIAGLIIGALLRVYCVRKSRTTKDTTRSTFGSPTDPCSTSQEIGTRNNPNADDCPNKRNENNSIVLRNYEYAEVVDINTTQNICLINDTNIASPETEMNAAIDEYSTILMNKNFQESTENVYDQTTSVCPPGSCRVRPIETNMVNTPDHMYDFTSVGVTEDTYNSIVNTEKTVVFSNDYDHIHPMDRTCGDLSSDYNQINSIN